MFADILGMTSQDAKELFMFIGGVVVVYFQYKNNQAAHDAKIQATQAVAEAKESRADLTAKLTTVENHIDGKMTLLLTEHGIVMKQEGVAEGKGQARAEADTMHRTIVHAVQSADIAKPVVEAATEKIQEVKELVKDVKEGVEEVPDKVVEKIKPDKKV